MGANFSGANAFRALANAKANEEAAKVAADIADIELQATTGVVATHKRAIAAGTEARPRLNGKFCSIEAACEREIKSMILHLKEYAEKTARREARKVVNV